MNPAPVYAPHPVLDCLQRPALRHLDDAEAAMLRVTAASLIEQALAWGGARAQFHGYQLEARREAGERQTLISLRVSQGAEVVVQEQVVLDKAAPDAARRPRH